MDNIKMDVREIEWDAMDWIYLAQDRDQWRAVVNTVMNFGFHKMLGSSCVAAQLASCQEGLSSMSK
jgi:predicted nucleotidyltransferase